MARPYVDYAKKMIGKRIDYDKWLWYQCVDLFKDYMKQVLGIHIPTAGNAKEVRTNKYYIFKKEWKRMSWTRDLMQWDIIVTSKWTYGHIAIFDHFAGGKVYVLEQNWSWKNSGNWLWENAIRIYWYDPSFWTGIRRCQKIVDNFNKEIAFIDAKLTTKLTPEDRKNTIDYRNSIRRIVK